MNCGKTVYSRVASVLWELSLDAIKYMNCGKTVYSRVANVLSVLRLCAIE